MRCSRSRSSVAACCATAEARRRLVRVRPGDLRVVARVVAACDRARPPPAPDRPRLRARRLEPGLDELHPGPGAAGLAADGGLRARAGLRRARAGRAGARGLVHVPPLPRARDGHAGRAGGRPRLRLRHLRGGRDAQPPQPRARVHAPAGRPRRRALPARRALRTAGSSCCFALCVARRVRDVPGDALLGHAGRRRSRSALGIAFTRGSERARLAPLPAAARARLRHRAARGGAVPVGRAGASRSARHQRPRLRARPRQPDRARRA